MEAIKLFMKEQFYLLKTSVLEINSNTDTANNNITEIRNFIIGNVSRNIIIKILAENQRLGNNTKEVNASESFKTVKGKKSATSQNHRTLSATINMTLFAQ